MDDKIREIKHIQKILRERTQMEEEAMGLIAQCQFYEANEILNSMPKFASCT